MMQQAPDPDRRSEQREQISRMLRYAFPVGTGSFSGLTNALKDEMPRLEARKIGR